MKKNIFWGIALVLALAMVLCACKEEEEVECGWLTIKNLPSVPFPSTEWGSQKYWFGNIYFEEEITSRVQLSNWTQFNHVASFENTDLSEYTGLSPFPLMEGYLKGFLRNGTYLVQIMPVVSEYSEQHRAIKNVVFRKGSATIDFNDMTKWTSLPQY